MNVPLPCWLIVSGDFIHTGGMDVGNYMLARFLAGSGAEVHLVAHRVAPELLTLPGIIFHRVPKPFGAYLFGLPLLGWYGRRWAARLAQRGGHVVVNGGNCRWGDLNWVHYVHAAHTPDLRGSWLRRNKNHWQHRWFLAGERRALAEARIVVANSLVTRRDLTERVRVPAERVEVVYYGVDGETFRPPSDAERLAARQALGWSLGRLKAVFIGALGDRRKGFDLLFDAWRQLCADPAWDVDLAVVGTGGELTSWQTRATGEHCLRDRIEFLGFRQDVPRILAAADLAIAPARYEAYGLGVREALCCGVPTIVSAEAGVAEHYPPELANALIPAPVDAASLTTILRRWHGQRDLWRERFTPLGEALRRMTWEDMCVRITTLAAHDSTEPGSRAA